MPPKFCSFLLRDEEPTELGGDGTPGAEVLRVTALQGQSEAKIKPRGRSDKLVSGKDLVSQLFEGHLFRKMGHT